MSVIYQFLILDIKLPLNEHVIVKNASIEKQVEILSKHITQFSLGGIREIKGREI